MSTYGFRGGPSYQPSTAHELFDAAFDQPMSDLGTFVEQVGGGVFDSFGAGTMLRTLMAPPLNTADRPARGESRANWEARRARAEDPSLSLTEEEYRKSAWYRPDIPWERGMTEERATVLAQWYDAKQVRAYFGEKRPVTAFVGNLVGQALDPINYIPIAGPGVKAAAAARLGFVGGHVAVGALDAAANTAVFGLATAPGRAKFGDDVSWQALTSDIATSALIGSVFGTVGGFLGKRSARRLEAIAASKAATLRSTQEARVGLNDAIGGLVEGGEVRLSPNAVAPIERLAREAEQLSFDEAVTGRTVVTPTGMRIQVRPEVVDASSLAAATGELQPRDRTRAASDAQIEDIAINLDPARLMFSPEADRGAPIVGPDGVVESGNGRVAALRRAAEAYPARFEDYRSALRAQGFDVPDEGVPVLVSRRVSELAPEDRVAFVAGANTSTISRMSASEMAMGDVRAMTDTVISSYAGGDVKSAANRTFVKGFVDNLPQNERASLLGAGGALNADGVRRVESSLVAAAYGDADLVARFSEATDDNAKSITGALADAAGDWVRMRRSVEAGDLDPELDLTGNLLDAVRLLSRARDEALRQSRPVHQLIDEAVRQIDMLSGSVDPKTEAFVRAFYQGEGYRRAKSREDLSAVLRAIVREIEAVGRPQLFAESAVNGADIMRAARDRAAQQGEIIDGRQGAAADGASPPQGGAGNGQPGLRRPGRTARQETGQEAGQGVGRQTPALKVDTSAGRPDAVPDGRVLAEQRLLVPEEYQAMAAQYRVDPKTGDFDELAEIEQLQAEGRLSEADRLELEAATKILEDGQAYGEAIRTAVGCLI